MRNSQESSLKTAQVVREPKPAPELMAAQMRFCKPIIKDPSISDDVREQISQISPGEIEKYKLVDVDGVKK